MYETATRATGLSSVVVTGIGMTTPVGDMAAQSITSIRAGIARLSEFPAFEPPVRDPSQHFPEPLIAARIPGLEEDVSLAKRLLAIAQPTLEWALDDAAGSDRASLGRTSLIIYGGEAPTTRAGSRIATTLAPRLAGRVAGFAPQHVAYSDGGSAGLLRGLAEAAARLTSGQFECVVIGAVDSLLAPETLAYLADQFRLKTPENPVGLTPGEAAAFIVLELDARAQRRGATPYARLGGMSSGMEPNGVHSEEVCTGAGLAACVLDVVRQMEAEGVLPAAIYCDLNGEAHAAQEWGYAISRIVAAGAALPEVLVHPADCIGEVGAAMGGVLVGLAADSLRNGKRGWAPSLIWCASDAGPRAAAYLGRA